MSIPEIALRYISKIEAISGQGGHRSTYRAASILHHGFGLSGDDALAVLLNWNEACASPPWSEHALRHKLVSAQAMQSDRPFGYLLSEHQRREAGLPTAPELVSAPSYPPRPRRPRWPKMDLERVIRLLETDLVTREQLQSSSPTPLSELPSSERIIEQLFCLGEESQPYLCLGKSVYQAESQIWHKWQGRLDTEPWELIVPNPMHGSRGATTTGKRSPRAKANVKTRRYIVIECDFSPDVHEELFEVLEEFGIGVHDLCATILAHLSQRAPLAMAVFSGNKSIHGWIPVLDASRRVQIDFFKQACRLGADPQMAQRHQWTRFPGGTRTDNGQRQTIEYYDPRSDWLAV